MKPSKIFVTFVIGMAAILLAACGGPGLFGPSDQDAVRELPGSFSRHELIEAKVNSCNAGEMDGKDVTVCQICLIGVSAIGTDNAFSGGKTGLQVFRTAASAAFSRAISSDQPNIAPKNGASGVWVVNRQTVTDKFQKTALLSPDLAAQAGFTPATGFGALMGMTYGNQLPDEVRSRFRNDKQLAQQAINLVGSCNGGASLQQARTATVAKPDQVLTPSPTPYSPSAEELEAARQAADAEAKAIAEQEGGKFGAFAISRSARTYSLAINESSQAEAERLAIEHCGKPDCKVSIWFKNTCGALAASRNGNAWKSAWSNDERDAQLKAMSRCSRCEVVTSACTSKNKSGGMTIGSNLSPQVLPWELTAYNEGTIKNPTWVARPTGKDFEAAYPSAALDKEIHGRAVLRCAVDDDGSMSGCLLIGEAPEGLGFGGAALKISRSFRMAPQLSTGESTAGGTVVLPIIFTFTS